MAEFTDLQVKAPEYTSPDVLQAKQKMLSPAFQEGAQIQAVASAHLNHMGQGMQKEMAHVLNAPGAIEISQNKKPEIQTQPAGLQEKVDLETPKYAGTQVSGDSLGFGVLMSAVSEVREAVSGPKEEPPALNLATLEPEAPAPSPAPAWTPAPPM